MTGELAPRDREMRISDFDRERAVEQLRVAVGGAITLEDFERRIHAIYQARTRGELTPLVADVAPAYQGRELLELTVRSGSAKRVGRWVAARRLEVSVGSGSVKLDFTEALVGWPEVEIHVAVRSGGVTIVLPQGGSAALDDVEVSSGAVRSRAPGVPEPGRLHVRVSGSVASGSVVVRYQSRWWRWLRDRVLHRR